MILDISSKWFRIEGYHVGIIYGASVDSCLQTKGQILAAIAIECFGVGHTGSSMHGGKIQIAGLICQDGKSCAGKIAVVDDSKAPSAAIEKVS